MNTYRLINKHQGDFYLDKDSSQLWFDENDVDPYLNAFAFVRFYHEGFEMKVFPVQYFRDKYNIETNKEERVRAFIKFGEDHKGKGGVFYLLSGDKLSELLLHGDNLWEKDK